jgi:hypothetical protein
MQHVAPSCDMAIGVIFQHFAFTLLMVTTVKRDAAQVFGSQCQIVDLGGAICSDLHDGRSSDDENIPFLT